MRPRCRVRQKSAPEDYRGKKRSFKEMRRDGETRHGFKSWVCRVWPLYRSFMVPKFRFFFFFAGRDRHDAKSTPDRFSLG